MSFYTKKEHVYNKLVYTYQIAIDKLRRAVEDAKIALSKSSETLLKVNNFFEGKDLTRKLTKLEVWCMFEVGGVMHVW